MNETETIAGTVQTGQETDTGLFFVLLDLGCDDPEHMPIFVGSVALAELVEASRRHDELH